MQKLAKKIADEQFKINKKIKIFLQVNIGNENQKSGINKKIKNFLMKLTYVYSTLNDPKLFSKFELINFND